MTGADIRALRRALTLSQRELGALLGAGQKTVGRWESEAAVPTPFARGLLERFAVAAKRPVEDLRSVLRACGVFGALTALLLRAVEVETEGLAGRRGGAVLMSRAA